MVRNHFSHHGMKFQNNFTIKKNIQIWKWKSFSPQFGSINDIRVMTSLRDTKDLCASIKLSADTTKTRIQTGFMFSPGQARHNWPSLPGLRRLVLGERQRGTTNGQIVFPLGALSCFGGKCGASTAPFRAQLVRRDVFNDVKWIQTCLVYYRCGHI